MDTLQNVTSQPVATRVDETQNVTPQKHNAFDHYITFCAAGGLATEDDGSLKPMTIEAFAQRVGVSRMTLNRWRRNTPGFEDMVHERRREIFTKSRIAKVWNGLYLKAAAGDVQAATMILSHFSDYTPPAQKVEHEVTGGLADLVQLMRARKIAENKVQVLDVAADSSTNAAE